MPGCEYECVFELAGTESRYVVIWLQYHFLRNEQEEAIAWINLIAGTYGVNHRWWSDEDINPERHSKNKVSKKSFWFFGKN
jgi:hypothetical protein